MQFVFRRVPVACGMGEEAYRGRGYVQRGRGRAGRGRWRSEGQQAPTYAPFQPRHPAARPPGRGGGWPSHHWPGHTGAPPSSYSHLLVATPPPPPRPRLPRPPLTSCPPPAPQPHRPMTSDLSHRPPLSSHAPPAPRHPTASHRPPHPPPSPAPHHPTTSDLSQGAGSSHRVQSVERPMIQVSQPLRRGQAPPTTLSIMTYNVLAQNLLQKNKYLYVTSNNLKWPFRRQLLLKELTEARADVVCLQEVEQEHYQSWFQPRLSGLGYRGLYQKRTGEHRDGCAVFYATSRLRVVDWKGVEFQRRVEVLDRDNVGIVVKFQMTGGKEGEEFCVATTHLLFNPKAGEVKLAQMACLLAELDLMARSRETPSSHLPCVLCGDLNSLPSSPLLRLLETSSLNYSRLAGEQVAGYRKRSHSRVIPVPLFPPTVPIGQDCRFHPSPSEATPTTTTTPHPKPELTHLFTFSSAYPHPSPVYPSTATTYHTSAFETVDYLFYTPTPRRGRRRPASSGASGEGAGFRLVSRRALIGAEQLLELGPQPHHLLPSDHLWLLACLQLLSS